MTNISYVIESKGAEKLWSCIQSYKERMLRGYTAIRKPLSENNLTFLAVCSRTNQPW